MTTTALSSASEELDERRWLQRRKLRSARGAGKAWGVFRKLAVTGVARLRF
jgi:hypothetical protein